MPSFSLYKQLSGSKTNGQARKNMADDLVDATWYEDINSKIVYLYDFYHDSEPLTLRGLTPNKDRLKTPVEAKFIRHESKTYNKDEVTFRLQFRPGHQCAVSYYKEVLGDRYDATYPVGLYVDIPDESGIYNRWLVVDKANYYGNQFPTYEVLPCGNVINYIVDGVKWRVPSVMRSQNS